MSPGEYWLLAYPDAACVCLATGEEVDELWANDLLPDTVTTTPVHIIPLKEFLQRAREAA